MKKKARIYIRVTEEDKRDFKKAAKHVKTTLSEWILRRLHEALRGSKNE